MEKIQLKIEHCRTANNTTDNSIKVATQQQPAPSLASVLQIQSISTWIKRCQCISIRESILKKERVKLRPRLKLVKQNIRDLAAQIILIMKTSSSNSKKRHIWANKKEYIVKISIQIKKMAERTMPIQTTMDPWIQDSPTDERSYTSSDPSSRHRRWWKQLVTSKSQYQQGVPCQPRSRTSEMILWMRRTWS